MGHMFSLTLTPTALIGLTDKLKIPKNFTLTSKSKPSIFAYPEPLQPPKKEEEKIAAKAVLSTAAKAKQLKEKKDKKTVADSAAEVASTAGGFNPSVMATPGTTIVGSTADSIAPSDLASDMMDVDDAAAIKANTVKPEDKDDKKEGEEDKKEPDVPEPTEENLNNPCRVLPSQKQFICFPNEVDGQASRYVPLLGDKRRTGFLVLRDQRPEEPEDLFLEDEKNAADDDEKEPEAPAPFEWTEADMA